MSTLTLTPRTHANDATPKTSCQKNLVFKREETNGKKDETVFKAGQKVFVRSNDLIWRTAVVSEVRSCHLVVNFGDSQDIEIPAKEAVLVPTDEAYQTVNDLTSISPLSAPAVLHCLVSRYGESEIYTWAGHTLVALNPFREHSHIYGTKVISQYHQLHKAEDTEHGQGGPPHVYSVAARAYNSMRCGALQPDQSIIVSGESGAGKTVSARHLMKYLVTAANHSPIGTESFGCEIERRILNSNPILEAFGNAGTVRNDNSSRFGKYIELQFDKFGYVSGAAIQTYLLEKTRVVQHAPKEHTFHIFYQMLAGMECEKKNQFWLNSSSLSAAGRSLDDDKRDWEATLDALTSIKISHQQLESITQILSAILHLNQISVCIDEEDEEVCRIDNEEDLVSGDSLTVSERACRLLGIEREALAKALTHRRITASHSRRKSVFSKPCTMTETRSRRDCLAKLLYNQLFEWLVATINRCIFTDQFQTTIGILDIYGFESFLSNSLEQLCINYANERLQQHYVTHFLRDLQAEYSEEAISWTDVEFVDNRPCLTLLEGGPAGSSPGLFPLINEECQVNRPGGDEGLRDRLLTALGNGPTQSFTSKSGHSPPGQLATPRQNRAEPSFVVNHYAAPVTYTARGLLKKNKDNVPPELVELLQDSSLGFIVQLFENIETEQPGKKKKTVLAKFKSSLDHLMEALSRTEPHYIRCIKPNQSSTPADPDQAFVLEQLRACGIVETVEVNRKGYPSRIPYERFLQHYSLVLRSMPDEESIGSGQPAVCNKENELVFDPLEVLYQKQLQLTPRRKSATAKKKLRRRAGLSSCDHTRKLTASILCSVFGQEFRLNPGAICQFGITKLFLRDGKLEQLERMRLKFASSYVFTLQCAWRRVMQRKRIKEQAAATRLQAVFRGYVQRVKFRRTLGAVKVLQRSVRCWLRARRLAEEEEEEAAAAAARKLMLRLANESQSSSDLRINLADLEEGSSPSEFFTARSDLTDTVSGETYHSSRSLNDDQDDTLTGDDPPAKGDYTTDIISHQQVVDRLSEMKETAPNTCPPGCGQVSAPTYSTPPARGPCLGPSSQQRRDNGVMLYSSPKADKGNLSPVTLPVLRRPAHVADDQSRPADAEAYYVVCEEQSDGCNTYHIMPSPCPGASMERPTEVLRRVTTSISTTYLSRWRFNMAGAFRGIPYLEAQNGIVSRRRMPRVQIKFHTRANNLLHGAHYISHREFQCSLSDCLV